MDWTLLHGFVDTPCKLSLHGVSSGGNLLASENEKTMSEDFPFKMETLLEQCGGNRDIAGVILDEFIIQVADDLKEMETCISSGNLVQVGKVGHRLKGTAGVLGAAKLYALCQTLETAGKGEDVDVVASTGPELKAEANRCIDAVPEARGRL